MNDIDQEQARRRLEQLRQSLRAELAGSAGDSAPVELDQSRQGRLSRMDAMQGQAMSQATDARRRLHLQQVDAALERLEHGEYGECLSCGEAINPKRLEIDPAAAQCIRCASRDE